jgi:hypothetical protein
MMLCLFALILDKAHKNRNDYSCIPSRFQYLIKNSDKKEVNRYIKKSSKILEKSRNFNDDQLLSIFDRYLVTIVSLLDEKNLDDARTEIFKMLDNLEKELDNTVPT